MRVRAQFMSVNGVYMYAILFGHVTSYTQVIMWVGSFLEEDVYLVLGVCAIMGWAYPLRPEPSTELGERENMLGQ